MGAGDPGNGAILVRGLLFRGSLMDKPVRNCCFIFRMHPRVGPDKQSGSSLACVAQPLDFYAVCAGRGIQRRKEEENVVLRFVPYISPASSPSG